jgi:hypothetical protein
MDICKNRAKHNRFCLNQTHIRFHVAGEHLQDGYFLNLGISRIAEMMFFILEIIITTLYGD